MSKFNILLKHINENYIHPFIEHCKRCYEISKRQAELEQMYYKECRKNNDYNMDFHEYLTDVGEEHLFGQDHTGNYSIDIAINSSTGLPMTGGFGGVDSSGNTYGSNFSTPHSGHHQPSYDYYNHNY